MVFNRLLYIKYIVLAIAPSWGEEHLSAGSQGARLEGQGYHDPYKMNGKMIVSSCTSRRILVSGQGCTG